MKPILSLLLALLTLTTASLHAVTINGKSYKIITKDGRQGLADSEGTVTVPVIYDRIDIGDNIIRAGKDNRWGYIDANNHVLVPLIYESLARPYRGLPNRACKDGVYGFIDKTGKTVIPFTLAGAGVFCEGMAAVKPRSGGKWGFIDTDGNTVINPAYDKVGNFTNGRAAVAIDGKMGFIDTGGRLVIPCRYDVVTGNDPAAIYNDPFSAAVAVVRIDSRYGGIDRAGKTIIPFEYDALKTRTSKYVELTKGSRSYYFDAGGNRYSDLSRLNAESDSILAIQGFPASQYNIGVIRYKAKDYTAAFKLFKSSAEQGYVNAFQYLAYLYGTGNGTATSKADAFAWYKKAAEATADPVAQYNLALYYENGYGTAADKGQATRWYQKSADQGYSKAAEALSRLNPEPKPARRKADIQWTVLPATATATDYQFTLQVNSPLPLYFVNILVNGAGAVCYDDPSGAEYDDTARDNYNITLNPKVKLSPGTNTISVEAANEAGTATSRREVTVGDNNLAKVTLIGFNPASTSRKFQLKAGINSASRIRSCQVTVNGETDRGINAVANDGYAMTLDRTITLAQGDNTIRIDVTNASGTATVEKIVTYTPADDKGSARGQRRIALVIGNSAYSDPSKRLKNPANDANDVAAKLRSLGFTVVLYTDQSLQGMDAAANRFASLAKDYDVALFYYAGHGINCDGINYLVPVDANLPSESYLKYNCLNANLVLDLMEKANCRMKIMILDACRNNPFAWSRGLDRGLSMMNAPKGTFIAFSTAPGDAAQDGDDNDRNSPYTAALLQTLDIPGLSITDLFQEVLERVADRTGDKQTPWTSNSFRGRFVFNPKKPPITQ